MIAGVHLVRKVRRDRPPIYYVYAYRGGPQIHRHEGWTPPRLSADVLRKLVAAADHPIDRVVGPACLSDLIRLWRPNSPEWQRLTANTKKTWSSALDKIEDRWGGTPLSVWNDPRMANKVFEWRDSRLETPRAADTGVSVLRALLKFGRLRGKVSINVAEGIPQLYRNGGRADIIWSDEDIAAFEAAASVMGMNHLSDGLRLAALTGLRRADLVSLTWDEVQTHSIVKRAAKSSKGRRRTATMPTIPALDKLLSELRNRHRADGVNTVLVNKHGKPWTGDGFGTSFN